MNKLAFAALAAGLLTATASADVWINEFHYDNAGADQNEFIEVVLSAGEDPNAVDVELYNGSNGTTYNTFNVGLDFTLGSMVPGFGSIYFIMLPANGIQNGAPDGIAITDTAAPFIQFLSYEGVFTATAGNAATLMSTDIGISEPGSGLATSSLGLNGTGTSYSDFTWTDNIDATPGFINMGQAVPAPGALALLSLAGVVARRRRRS